MLNFIASGSDITSESGKTGDSSGICGFCQRTLPPQYHGFQNGNWPYSTTLLITEP